MRSTESKRIGDHEYSVTQFPPMEALEYQLELLKVLGKPIAGLYGQIKVEGLGSSLEETTVNLDDFKLDIENGVGILSDSIHPKKHAKFIRDMMRYVLIDGSALKFDIHFQGKIMDIYQVLMFVIQVNYPDFFSKIVGAIASRSASVSKKPSEKQEESQATYP